MTTEQMLPETLEFDRAFSDEIGERLYLTNGLREWICVGFRRAIGKAPEKSFQMYPIFHPLKVPGDPKSVDKSHKMQQFIGVPVLNPEADEPASEADLLARKKKLDGYRSRGVEFLRKLLGPERVPYGFRKDNETGVWTFGGEELPADMSGEERKELSQKHKHEMGELLVKLWSDKAFQKDLVGYTIYADTTYNDRGYIQASRIYAGDNPPDDRDVVDPDNWETTTPVGKGDDN